MLLLLALLALLLELPPPLPPVIDPAPPLPVVLARSGGRDADCDPPLRSRPEPDAVVDDGICITASPTTVNDGAEVDADADADTGVVIGSWGPEVGSAPLPCGSAVDRP